MLSHIVFFIFLTRVLGQLTCHRSGGDGLQLAEKPHELSGKQNHSVRQTFAGCELQRELSSLCR
jgi:hypothetical protein